MSPPRRILVVDDSLTVRLSLSRLLTAAGFEVKVATRAEEGLAAALPHPPDLVISDVSMPEKDGFWLCQELKRAPTTRRVPVMLFTRLDESGEILKGLSAGADAFVLKEAGPEELVERVERLLSAGEASRRQGMVQSVIQGLQLTRDREDMFRLLHQSLDKELGFDVLTFLYNRQRGKKPLIACSWSPMSPELENALINKVLASFSPLASWPITASDLELHQIINKSDRWPIAMRGDFHGLQIPLVENNLLVGQISVFTFNPELRMESEVHFLFEVGLSVARGLTRLDAAG